MNHGQDEGTTWTMEELLELLGLEDTRPGTSLDFFQTPAIYTDDLSPTEWEARLNQMLDRAQATQQYRMGQMTPEDFEDALATYGIPDPYVLADGWERGLVWLGTP